MGSEYFRALISLKTYSTESFDLLKEITKEIGLAYKIENISSVYKVKSRELANKDIHSLRDDHSYEGLAVVLMIHSMEDHLQLLGKLKDIEQTRQTGLVQRNTNISLLVFEDVTLMTPKLTLPHPEFHLRAEDLVPAAEVWGEYTHPVLKENIYSLTKRASSTGWGEFFAQGKSLLDF